MVSCSLPIINLLTVENHCWIKDQIIHNDLIIVLFTKFWLYSPGVGFWKSLDCWEACCTELCWCFTKYSLPWVQILKLVRQDIVLGHLKNVAFNFTILTDLLSAIEPETFGKILLQKEPPGWVRLFQEQENERWWESRKKHTWIYT